MILRWFIASFMCTSVCASAATSSQADSPLGLTELELQAIRTVNQGALLNSISQIGRDILLAPEHALAVINTDGQWQYRIRSANTLDKKTGHKDDKRHLSVALENSAYKTCVVVLRQRMAAMHGTSIQQHKGVLGLIDNTVKDRVLRDRLYGVYGEYLVTLPQQELQTLLRDPSGGKAIRAALVAHSSQENARVKKIENQSIDPAPRGGTCAPLLAGEYAQLWHGKGVVGWKRVRTGEGETALYKTNLGGGVHCYARVPENMKETFLKQDRKTIEMMINAPGVDFFCGKEGMTQTWKLDSRDLKKHFDNLKQRNPRSIPFRRSDN